MNDQSRFLASIESCPVIAVLSSTMNLLDSEEQVLAMTVIETGSSRSIPRPAIGAETTPLGLADDPVVPLQEAILHFEIMSESDAGGLEQLASFVVQVDRTQFGGRMMPEDPLLIRLADHGIHLPVGTHHVFLDVSANGGSLGTGRVFQTRGKLSIRSTSQVREQLESRLTSESGPPTMLFKGYGVVPAFFDGNTSPLSPTWKPAAFFEFSSLGSRDVMIETGGGLAMHLVYVGEPASALKHGRSPWGNVGPLPEPRPGYPKSGFRVRDGQVVAFSLPQWDGIFYYEFPVLSSLNPSQLRFRGRTDVFILGPKDLPARFPSRKPPIGRR